jgi:hypothetical protein
MFRDFAKQWAPDRHHTESAEKQQEAADMFKKYKAADDYFDTIKNTLTP